MLRQITIGHRAHGFVKAIPNALSLFRLLSPAALVYLYTNGARSAALLLFFLAGATDFFDGFLARKYSVTSRFGAALDAFADKVMVNALFVFFYLAYQLPEWLIVITLIRDAGIILGSLFFFFMQKRKARVLMISKINTTLQLLLLLMIFTAGAFSLDIETPKVYVIILTGLTTALSAISYLCLFLGIKT